MAHPQQPPPTGTGTAPPRGTTTTAPETETDFLLETYTRLRQAIDNNPNDPHAAILPSPSTLTTTLSSLPTPTSPSYLLPLGPSQTHAHLLHHILPALNHQSLSARYFGFVTGSVLPIAEAADNLVSALDQNVQVHFPPASVASASAPWAHSACTAVEDAALRMLVSLVELDHTNTKDGGSVTTEWTGRTFTTGATAGNILGLACGREYVVNLRAAAKTKTTKTVAEDGLLAACQAGGVKEIQVLTSMGHSSLAKAASLAGLGHASVKELGVSEAEPWRLDLDAVEKELKRAEAGEGVVSIVVVSAGEVNTGRFATNVLDLPKLRSLADRYGAWIHVDGAFGLFARALPKTDEFLGLHASAAGLELADSIAADGHKLLNVPYDNGIFLCRNPSILTQVCNNPNAAYLASPGDPSAILSPLNIGIENSRRFRALPVYAVLLSEGREGIAAMLSRMVLLAREIAAFVRDSQDYEWLPSEDASLESTYIVVLFRARDAALNDVLVDRINASGKMFVSGTKWAGKKAVRIAVGSWRVDVERDAAIIKEALTAIAEAGK
ncbi:pyridoxal phosphate-dependent transferase [Chaetomidium leptoderma]|uniref:Pyridoxal phosphate-dependent transferase n=1 Tax=Chaetomidium leptoderma TaxID=669021 RepID=A0AAN6VRX6_9PEZI|nr:pyridoxal phosphate-dependent transferase [Chaetomidium leptoderma]